MDDQSFVDIHCHILPGLDDGPSTWEESLQMAEFAVSQGVVTLVATPHQLGAFSQNSADIIRETWKEFKDKLNEENIPLQVECGADIRIEPELPAKVARGEILPLGPAGRYVLVEPPPDVAIPLGWVVDALKPLGLTPILTHPERAGLLSRQLDLLRHWVAKGGLIQLTGGSLMGAFGLEVQARAERLLYEGLVHVVASDAHGIFRRRPLWQRFYERLKELVGSQGADLLCRQNPRRIIHGQKILSLDITGISLVRIVRRILLRAG